MTLLKLLLLFLPLSVYSATVKSTPKSKITPNEIEAVLLSRSPIFDNNESQIVAGYLLDHIRSALENKEEGQHELLLRLSQIISARYMDEISIRHSILDLVRKNKKSQVDELLYQIFVNGDDKSVRAYFNTVVKDDMQNHMAYTEDGPNAEELHNYMYDLFWHCISFAPMRFRILVKMFEGDGDIVNSPILKALYNSSIAPPPLELATDNSTVWDANDTIRRTERIQAAISRAIYKVPAGRDGPSIMQALIDFKKYPKRRANKDGYGLALVSAAEHNPEDAVNSISRADAEDLVKWVARQIELSGRGAKDKICAARLTFLHNELSELF